MIDACAARNERRRTIAQRRARRDDVIDEHDVHPRDEPGRHAPEASAGAQARGTVAPTLRVARDRLQRQEHRKIESLAARAREPRTLVEATPPTPGCDRRHRHDDRPRGYEIGATRDHELREHVANVAPSTLIGKDRTAERTRVATGAVHA